PSSCDECDRHRATPCLDASAQWRQRAHWLLAPLVGDGSGREECVRDCGEMLIKGKRRFVLVAAASGLAEDATGDPKPDPDEDNLRPKTFYQFQVEHG
ncbi:unnamed protein product, partial [Symbiodinium microadriaticum]